MSEEIDFSSLWTWTIPLWALVILVAFLGGELSQPFHIAARAVPPEKYIPTNREWTQS
jgi:hypothetical protein